MWLQCDGGFRDLGFSFQKFWVEKIFFHPYFLESKLPFADQQNGKMFEVKNISKNQLFNQFNCLWKCSKYYCPTNNNRILIRIFMILSEVMVWSWIIWTDRQLIHPNRLHLQSIHSYTRHARAEVHSIRYRRCWFFTW